MRRNPLTKALAGLTITGLLAASFIFGFGLGTSRSQASFRYALLDEASSLIEGSALKRPGRSELVRGAVGGLVGALNDPYASYLDRQAFRVFNEENTSGQFSGVGVWLNRDGETIKVVTVLQASPAGEAGILAGDTILEIDGRTIGGLSVDEVARRIMGRVGTQVRLEIAREAEQPREFVLNRRKLDLPGIRSELKGAVGTINLVSFVGGVGAKLREAVDSLERRGARGFILDLRGNPGGSVQEAVDVASVFLDGGKVVSYRERGKQEVTFEASGGPQTRLPLVVVVDEGSASASEIVAGAIQDRRRGLIVGAETYKKGSVQRVFALSDGSAIKLTIASYFTPSGRAIGERGVIPDVTVAVKDQQLSKANDILSGMVAASPGRAAG